MTLAMLPCRKNFFRGHGTVLGSTHAKFVVPFYPVLTFMGWRPPSDIIWTMNYYYVFQVSTLWLKKHYVGANLGSNGVKIRNTLTVFWPQWKGSLTSGSRHLCWISSKSDKNCDRQAPECGQTDCPMLCCSSGTDNCVNADILDQELLSLLLLLFFCLLGQHSSNRPQALSFQNQIEMKFENIVLQVNMHQLTESWRHAFKIAAMTFARRCMCSSVRQLPASLPRRVTSLDRCMRYSSWSIVHSYSFYSLLIINNHKLLIFLFISNRLRCWLFLMLFVLLVGF